MALNVGSRHIKQFLPSLVAVATVGMQFLFGQERSPAPEELSLAEFLELGSCTLSEESGHTKLLVVSRFANGPLQLLQILAWRHPNQAALLILDAHDNTPIMAAGAGQSVIYDPVGKRLVATEDGAVDYFFKLEGDELNSSFGWKSGRENRIEVDFGSLFRASMESVKLGRDAAEGFTFEGSSRSGNSHIRAVVDPKAVIALQRFEIFDGGDSLPSFMFERIDGDPSLDREIFESPIERAKGLALPTEKVDLEEWVKLADAIIRPVVFRLGIANPDARPKLGLRLPESFDWEEAGKQDSKASKELRDIFLRPFKDLAIQPVGTGQPAARPGSKPEGGDKLQPDAEGRPR